MIRYGNDLVLTEIAIQINGDIADMNACIRDGHLDSAFKFSLILQDKLTRLQERLNELKYGRV